MGVDISTTLVKRGLSQLGLAHPPGAAGHRTSTTVQTLGLAGAELLKAVDHELGATAALTTDIKSALCALPQPDGPVRQDTDNRDERGRFKAAYNEPRERTEPELGDRFDSVELKRQGKDLSQMRTTNSSYESLHRKVQALVLLPCGTDSARWDGLRHWSGEAYEGLVGVPYMPATLDKFARELKYAGGGGVARESLAAFWLGRPALLGESPVQGAAALYVDTAVNPVWTHHFSRCAKVARLGGRVMPATSTTYLNAGCGTPVLYTSCSGHTSLPKAVGGLLDSYESIAGPDTAQRLVVMDREGHAAWLLKELRDRDWDFIVPLRQSSVDKPERFCELTDWVPYKDKGDEVRGGRLELNDSKAPDESLQVRVVGRKRRRTGKVAWYATLADAEAFSDPTVLDLYFARWPLQELVFRDGNGRVHLGAHYGYGRRKVDNVAVLDRLDKIQGYTRKLDIRVKKGQQNAQALRAEVTEKSLAINRVSERLDALRAELDASVAQGRAGTATFKERYASARALESWLASNRNDVASQAEDAVVLERKVKTARSRRKSLQDEQAILDSRRRIFTVDVELDELMTAFKLTFMNLCGVLMTQYLGKQMQLDTLIRGILTLPGERVRTPTTETIRIYRHERDRQLMPLVEAACQKLTEQEMVRDKRRLRFEVVDRPVP